MQDPLERVRLLATWVIGEQFGRKVTSDGLWGLKWHKRTPP